MNKEWTPKIWVGLEPNNDMENSKQKFIEVMRILYQVWAGTDNASEVLDDASLTFASEIFKLNAQERQEFLRQCQWGLET